MQDHVQGLGSNKRTVLKDLSCGAWTFGFGSTRRTNQTFPARTVVVRTSGLIGRTLTCGAPQGWSGSGVVAKPWLSIMTREKTHTRFSAVAKCL